MAENFYQPDLLVLHQNSNDISPYTLYTHEIRYNIIYVFDGSLSVTYDKQNFLLKKNNALLISPISNIDISYPDNKFDALVIQIDPILFKNTQDETDIFRSFENKVTQININSFSTPLAQNLFNSIKTCILDLKGRYHVASRVIALVCELACEYDRKKGIQKLPQTNIALKTINYIEKHFTENITLESSSQALGISKNSISRICRAFKGNSFLEYVTKLRLKKAQTLLQNENYSIKNIAILSGFKSYNSFYKTYLKFYGEKPSLKSKKIQEKLYWPFESANQPFLNQ